MENPQKPNNFNPDNNKRKASSNEDDDESNKKREKLRDEDGDTDDPLALSLSSYSDRKARPVVNPPPDTELQMQHHQQQMHMRTLLSPSSPPQLPFNCPPPFMLMPQPPQILSAGLEPHPAHAPVNVPARSPSPPPRIDPIEGRGNDDTVIVPPFPWATNRPARVHTLKHLIHNKIFVITGEVQCGSCHHKFEMRFDLQQKFHDLCMFIQKRKPTMHDRAPEEWSHPVLPTCEHCKVENSVKPIIGDAKEHRINWLFLLLGQMLGMCTLEHLRYFCEHTMHHRSGAKNRVLYHTYIQLIKQLKGEA